MTEILAQFEQLLSIVDSLPLVEKIETMNQMKTMMHDHSPFRDEPVDCIVWVPADTVEANDYNPNKVAPPEMRLLEHSILEDGYTQPIVTWNRVEFREVIDGFHRNRVGKESKAVRERLHGYLPVTTINSTRSASNDRMAATIRHNRARGKHQVTAMSEIVQALAKRNWDNEKISKELGMDADEVLRLKQIGGLAEMFADREFSEAWEIDEDEQPDPNL